MHDWNDGHDMHRFVVVQNIERYRRLLEVTTDANERKRIMKLLSEEEAKITLREASRP
jgi:hypothetical protein